MSLVDTYHAYFFGTAFWYGLRGMARVTDPARVSSWFRPPAQPSSPNDLELYTIWTDGFQLLTLAMIMVVFAAAVPLPTEIFGSFSGSAATQKALKPFARALILATLFHHITTGIGAYTHWVRPSHHTVAMDIGVYGNVGLTLLGIAALVSGLREPSSSTKKVS
ncbi:hypothetical protein AMS68_003095 [Peltaster fructicola]|uniref:Uncharacterized protein n=1 Tax=Peltaster fructicola TaxID=286661 RepID=A0A6H0XSI0_9PEZI|nr:hypothetical protein AMS68_003095 [Peltaster fructicola]